MFNLSFSYIIFFFLGSGWEGPFEEFDDSQIPEKEKRNKPVVNLTFFKIIIVKYKHLKH